MEKEVGGKGESSVLLVRRGSRGRRKRREWWGGGRRRGGGGGPFIPRCVLAMPVGGWVGGLSGWVGGKAWGGDCTGGNLWVYSFSSFSSSCLLSLVLCWGRESRNQRKKATRPLEPILREAKSGRAERAAHAQTVPTMDHHLRKSSKPACNLCPWPPPSVCVCVLSVYRGNERRGGSLV